MFWPAGLGSGHHEWEAEAAGTEGSCSHHTAHHWEQTEGGERTPVLSLPALFYATQNTIVRDVVPPT